VGTIDSIAVRRKLGQWAADLLAVSTTQILRNCRGMPCILEHDGSGGGLAEAAAAPSSG